MDSGLSFTDLITVLHKCADAMENGKRFENLSWRLFSCEIFCCAPKPSLTPPLHFDRKRNAAVIDEVPELPSSVESSSFDGGLHITTKNLPTRTRPEVGREASTERKDKHITPADLERIVVSIKSRKDLVKLSPLPLALVPTEPITETTYETSRTKLVLNRDSIPQPTSLPPTTKPTSYHVFQPSTSTVATNDFSDMSPPLASSETINTDVSATNIVRGFSEDHMSCSARSQSNLVPTSTPTPSGSILKSSVTYSAQALAAQPKTKSLAAKLTHDSSSEEAVSSFGKSSIQSNLIDVKKTTSSNEEVSNRKIKPSINDEAVFEDSDEEDQQSSSAIEGDDFEEDWEDEDEPSVPSSINEREMFPRVNSKHNLVSRRSLLTSMMHEKDCAAAMQNAAFRSTPAIRRSRTSSPNGPLNLHAEAPTSIAQGLEASRARPIIMPTSNVHPPALSPRTTRRNMLSSELTDSLRKNLLWNRQVFRSITNAASERRHTAKDMSKLQHVPGENAPAAYMPANVPQSVKNSWNHNYFESGLQEYHQRGW